mmetsp:Transcript_16341/g.19326  ORF Transcript_16341/g.19326 Transcript_16341/m.19326 type:complete len:1650 (+) Transcript_16341:92-5041(+)
MGGGVSQPEDTHQSMKWSVKDGQVWVEYGHNTSIRDALCKGFLNGDDLINNIPTVNGQMLNFDIDAMVEINVTTMKRRDLRCEYSGEHPPKRPKPYFEQSELDEFEAHILSFLVSNQLRFSDIFHEIDHDRNGWLTKSEVHSFFLHNIWTETPPDVTTHIFASMESGGDVGRVSYYSFSHAAKKMKKVLAFESQKKSVILTKKLALKQSRAAAASSRHSGSKIHIDPQHSLPERFDSNLSSPVEVFKIPSAIFGDDSDDDDDDGKNEMEKDDRDQNVVVKGKKRPPRIRIPLKYKEKSELSPRSWIVASWYWRVGARASEARHLSALACSKSHALLMLNSHRVHHHTEDAEKLKQQELHKAATEFASEVSNINKELDEALTLAIEEEKNNALIAKEKVLNLDQLIKVESEKLEILTNNHKKVDRSNINLLNSSWELIEDSRAKLHILQIDYTKAQQYHLKASTLPSISSTCAKHVSEMTAVLIENTRLMAQAIVNTELSRIDLHIAENEHVVRYKQAHKKICVLQAQSTFDIAKQNEVSALRLYNEAEINVDKAVQALDCEDLVYHNSIDYLKISELRNEVQCLFDANEAKLNAKGGKGKDDEGYYPFTESSLGQTLFNARGTVAPEFRSHQLHIAPYREHLSGDRGAWGALLTAIFNQWTKTPSEIRVEAKKSLRYVVFNSEVRALGYSALLREDWCSLVKDDKLYRKACGSAIKRFKMSQAMKDDIGVDFFVSHNWSDENAPYRWAALVKLSDLFQQKFGRLPRFWLDRFCIDQSRQDDIAAKTSSLPATIMSCNFVVVLQSPQYMGCSAPPCALPSLWCIMEFFTLCTLAPAHDPTTNLFWIPLFKSSRVPPTLDLLHGRVYCYSDEDKARLLSQLASCPGGLVEVQRAMAAVWPVHFKSAYAEWALLSQAAGDGDSARVEALLSKNVSVDLPFEWSPSSSLSTMTLVAAAMLHEQWRAARRKQLMDDGEYSPEACQRWKPITSKELSSWFVPALHSTMIRTTTNQETGDVKNEVDINHPFGLLPPSWQRENEKQARAGLDVLRQLPDKDMETWAESVHNSWVARRVEENNNIMPQWVIDANQDVPYSKLTEVEKEKDRVVVRTALYLRTDLSASRPELIDLGASLPRLARSPPTSSSSGTLYDQGNEYSACQPLQAAVFRFLKQRKIDPHQEAGGSNQINAPKTSPGDRLSGRLSGRTELDNVDSCLDDKIIKMLVAAGADPLDAINQPILGHDKLEDEVVFKVLEDLLTPLYKKPPHCLSLTYNRLSTAGATRLLRFQIYVNEKAQASGLSPPLVSLCGLTPEAIRANWPEDIDDDGEDLSESVNFDMMEDNNTPEITTSNNEMLRFQAVNQPHLRAASFTLLLSELTSAPHSNTLTCLDLSHNTSLVTELVRFGPLSNLQRINLERCPNVSGTLEPFAACCTLLTHLRLCGTSVGGPLPSLGTMLPSLRILDLASTKVNGKLDGLLGASELRSLKCHGTKGLNGTLFPGLKKCSSLRMLDLSGTALSGTLDGAANLPKLESVVLEHCKNLTGSIVPLSDCPKLKEMNVNLTNLSGGPSLAINFKKKCRCLRHVRALNCPRFLHGFEESQDVHSEQVDDVAGSRSPTLKNATRVWKKTGSIIITQSQLNALFKELKNLDVAYTD